MAGKIKPSVLWSHKATTDLAAIIAFLESEWNGRTITTFLVRLEDLINRIQSFPTIRRKSTKRPNVHLISLEPYHQIIYKRYPRKNIIAILQLWDTRQDPRKRKA